MTIKTRKRKKNRKGKKKRTIIRWVCMFLFITLAIGGAYKFHFTERLKNISVIIPKDVFKKFTSVFIIDEKDSILKSKDFAFDKKKFFARKKSLTIHAKKLMLPSRLHDRKEQIIHHTGYTVSYNEVWRIPNWVAYELTKEKTKGKEKRARHFVPDPQVIGISAQNQDYARSGYDRGHMAPAGDMKWSRIAMKESFYFSNICPQLHSLNAGDWKELEEKVRNWADRDSVIIILSGPVIEKNPRRIGKNKVAIPDAFFKVILSPYIPSPRAIGFIMKQQKENRPLRMYAVSADSIEKLTGIDFFPVLPDNIEKEIESSLKIEDWNL